MIVEVRLPEISENVDSGAVALFHIGQAASLLDAFTPAFANAFVIGGGLLSAGERLLDRARQFVSAAR